ncbi:hypothetical protein [Streptomyces sp. NPDC093225]|uniref:hypothetical protein n=1 Tax=Streptomyces sp. NPDC093225 TaxID=3366034 RepID=UPI00380A2163
MPEDGQGRGAGRDRGGRLPRGRLRPALLAGLGTAVAATAGAAALWAPDQVLPWAGGVATASLVAYLGQVAPTQLGAALGRRRAERDPAAAAPFTLGVRVQHQDVVSVADGDRILDLPAAGHTVRIVLTGTGPRPVVLTGLRAEVLERAERYGELSRHAAQITPRAFAVLLDEDPPPVLPLGESDFPYGLAADETEVIDVRADVARGHVRWVLWLDWTSGDRNGTTRVDVDGRPFQTVARTAPA